MNFSTVAQDATRLLIRVPTMLTIAVITRVTAAIPSATSALQYDRGRIMAGELWRLATCHLTHWNGEHLLWDWLMFVVLGAWCEWKHPKRMRLCLVFGAAAVTGVVFVMFPHIQTYRGLSGIDTALFTLLAIELLREGYQSRDRWLCLTSGGLLLGFLAKTAYEATVGRTVFVDEQAAGFIPLVWDHLAGASVGALFALRPLDSWRTGSGSLTIMSRAEPIA